MPGVPRPAVVTRPVADAGGDAGILIGALAEGANHHEAVLGQFGVGTAALDMEVVFGGFNRPR